MSNLDASSWRICNEITRPRVVTVMTRRKKSLKILTSVIILEQFAFST